MCVTDVALFPQSVSHKSDDTEPVFKAFVGKPGSWFLHYQLQKTARS
jgi:hypothetical protein